MAAFPLLGELDFHLLEKIITTLDVNSYFRLQQMCHRMAELIRKSQNISVRMDIKLEPIFNESKLSKFDLWCYEKEVAVEDLHGILIGEICVSDLTGKAEVFCNFLTNYRKFLECAKPKGIVVYGYGIDLAFRKQQLLKQVIIETDPKEAATLAPRLFSTFPEVEIRSRGQRSDNVALFRSVLQHLRSKSFANLRKVDLHMRNDGSLHFRNLKKMLGEFGFATSSSWCHKETNTTAVQMDNGFYCKIISSGYGRELRIAYEEGYPEPDDNSGSSCCPSSDGEDF